MIVITVGTMSAVVTAGVLPGLRQHRHPTQQCTLPVGERSGGWFCPTNTP